MLDKQGNVVLLYCSKTARDRPDVDLLLETLKVLWNTPHTQMSNNTA